MGKMTYKHEWKILQSVVRSTCSVCCHLSVSLYDTLYNYIPCWHGIVKEFRYVGICISPSKNFIWCQPTILESPMYCREKNISYMGSATVHIRVIMQAPQTATYLRCQYRKLCSKTETVNLVLWEVQIYVLCRMHCTDTFFFWLDIPLLGQGVLIVEALQSHSDTPYPVGHLWTGDHAIAETSTWQYTTLTKDRHPFPSPQWGLNPQSKQANGHRPTPQTMWSLVSALFIIWRHAFKMPLPSEMFSFELITIIHC
jgi:hypothetical protein